MLQERDSAEFYFEGASFFFQTLLFAIVGTEGLTDEPWPQKSPLLLTQIRRPGLHSLPSTLDTLWALTFRVFSSVRSVSVRPWTCEDGPEAKERHESANRVGSVHRHQVDGVSEKKAGACRMNGGRKRLGARWTPQSQDESQSDPDGFCAESRLFHHGHLLLQQQPEAR